MVILYPKTKLKMIEMIANYKHDTATFEAWKYDIIEKLKTVKDCDFIVVER